MALFSSGNHNADGTLAATFRDLPWNHGAVWSMNSMPGIAGETNDFKTKWNLQVRQRLYGLQRKGDLDGEYIDSSEGYVTDELDFHRDHFAAAERPWCSASTPIDRRSSAALSPSSTSARSPRTCTQRAS